MNKSAVLCVMFGLFLACPDPSLAVPTILLSESFDSENGGLGVLDYSGFGGWTVSDGTVDLIGNGLYIALDASTRSAGNRRNCRWQLIKQELPSAGRISFCDIHRGLYSSCAGIGVGELCRGWRRERWCVP